MKKIMFNDRFGLTKAVINGTKTQTRRIIPEKQLCDAMAYGGGDIELRNLALLLNAPYKVGDVVAVAQSYEDAGLPPSFDCIGQFQPNAEFHAGWKNKMFVKAELMPDRIKITRVRFQQLQDISDEDCLKEGIYYDEKNGKSVGYPFAVPFYYTFKGAFNTKTGRMLHWTTPREAYTVLIDRVSGKGTWERNPYVLAYDFELVTNCNRLS